MTGAPIRVALVDDQQLVRAGLRMIVESDPAMTVVGEAGDGRAAVDLVIRSSPDVVLMDVRMPVLDGIQAAARLTAAGVPARILMLTTFDLDEYVHDALRAGASGFLLKDAPPDQLLAAIRVVAAGDALLDPAVTRRLIEQVIHRVASLESPLRRAVDELTEREREVFRLIARGLSNAEIAAQLYLGEATVKTHVGRVLAKLGVRDRVQAVVAAYESGEVVPGVD